MQVYSRTFPAWLGVLIGLFLIAAGVGLLMWPFVAASNILAILFGVALVASGVGMVARPRAGSGSVVLGVLLIICGVIASVWSEFTATFLVSLAGAFVIFVGIALLMLAVRLAQPVFIVGAVAVLVTGVITLVFPGFALKIVAVLAGVCFVVWGVQTIRFWISRRGGTHTVTRL